MWLWIVGWIICGILAYGMTKDNWRQFFETLTYVGYDSRHENFCILSVIMGPVGLLVMIFIVLSEGYKFGLCYHMPKELCVPRRSEWGVFFYPQKYYIKGLTTCGERSRLFKSWMAGKSNTSTPLRCLIGAKPSRAR